MHCDRCGQGVPIGYRRCLPCVSQLWPELAHPVEVLRADVRGWSDQQLWSMARLPSSDFPSPDHEEILRLERKRRLRANQPDVVEQAEGNGLEVSPNDTESSSSASEVLRQISLFERPISEVRPSQAIAGLVVAAVVVFLFTLAGFGKSDVERLVSADWFECGSVGLHGVEVRKLTFDYSLSEFRLSRATVRGCYERPDEVRWSEVYRGGWKLTEGRYPDSGEKYKAIVLDLGAPINPALASTYDSHLRELVFEDGAVVARPGQFCGDPRFCSRTYKSGKFPDGPLR